MMSFVPLALRATRWSGRRLKAPLNTNRYPLQRLATCTYANFTTTKPDKVADFLKYKPLDPVSDVQAQGFVRSVRSQKRNHFVALGDGSSLDSLQAVVPADQAEG